MMRSIATALCLCVIAGLVAEPAAADDSIYDIQLGFYVPGDGVEVDSVIVTGIYAFGFFVQEPDPDPTFGRQYSGIWVYSQNAPTGIAVGDLVFVEGEYQEFFDESEIDVSGGLGSYFSRGPSSVPPPVNVLITDVYGQDAGLPPGPFDGPFAEAYEGVYVEVTQPDMVSCDTLRAGCASATMSRWGIFQTTSPGDTLFVRNSVVTHEIPPPGATINFLRGPMSFHQCARKVVPRNNDDVGFVGPPNVVWAYSTGPNTVVVEFSQNVEETSAQTAGNYSFLSGLPVTAAVRDAGDHTIVRLTTGNQPNILDQLFVANIESEASGFVMPAPQDVEFWTSITPITGIQFVAAPALNDASPKSGQIVTIQGVATTSNSPRFGDSRFWVADAPGPWNGMRIGFIPEIEVDIGDGVLAAGTVREDFGQTELEFQGYSYSENLGPATPITPVAVDPIDVPWTKPGESEQYEGVLVRVENAEIDSVDGAWEFGEWWMVTPTDAPGDTSKFDHRSDVSDPAVEDLAPCVGDVVNVTGVVEYSFSQYRVDPRVLSDFERVSLNPSGCIVATGEVAVPISMLLRNYPNPFNPSTTIEFMMPERGRAHVEIFDVNGRILQTLVSDQILPEGRNEVRWDGRDASGAPVASGTYFYRVVMGKESFTNRMTLVK